MRCTAIQYTAEDYIGQMPPCWVLAYAARCKKASSPWALTLSWQQRYRSKMAHEPSKLGETVLVFGLWSRVHRVSACRIVAIMICATLVDTRTHRQFLTGYTTMIQCTSQGRSGTGDSGSPGKEIWNKKCGQRAAGTDGERWRRRHKTELDGGSRVVYGVCSTGSDKALVILLAQPASAGLKTVIRRPLVMLVIC